MKVLVILLVLVCVASPVVGQDGRRSGVPDPYPVDSTRQDSAYLAWKKDYAAWQFRQIVYELCRESGTKQPAFWEPRLFVEPDPMEDLQRRLDYIQWMLEQQERRESWERFWKWFKE